MRWQNRRQSTNIEDRRAEGNTIGPGTYDHVNRDTKGNRLDREVNKNLNREAAKTGVPTRGFRQLPGVVTRQADSFQPYRVPGTKSGAFDFLGDADNKKDRQVGTQIRIRKPYK